MKNGQLYINGVAAPLKRIGTFTETFEPQGPMRGTPRCSNAPVGEGAVCEKELWQETLPNGVVHDVLNIDNSFADNTPVFTVPEGQFFFMGDNRDNSGDSRFPRNVGGVGFVPFEDLVGRANMVVFSSAGRWIPAFWTWRSDRYFKWLD
jgi:signal peptidase I